MSEILRGVGWDAAVVVEEGKGGNGNKSHKGRLIGIYRDSIRAPAAVWRAGVAFLLYLFTRVAKISLRNYNDDNDGEDFLANEPSLTCPAYGRMRPFGGSRIFFYPLL